MTWQDKIIEYYDAHARDLPWRRTKDPYKIWLSEIMLQQTRVESVIGYYERFLKRYPDMEALASADTTELMKVWEGLGYYSRANNLKKCAETLVKNGKKTLPASYEELVKLPGIGPYTAGAISSIAYDLPEPAVDGNYYRVYTRLVADGSDITNAKVKSVILAEAKRLVPKEHPGKFNQGIMDIGATICLPNGSPLCGQCPLSDVCKAHLEGNETGYPVKQPKRKRKVIQKTVFALRTERGYLGYKRSNGGLLAELYQLPDIDERVELPHILEYLGNNHLVPNSEIQRYDRKHIFTHIEWDMTVYALDVHCDTLPEGWCVLNLNAHPLPTAYKKCLPDAE